MIKTILKGIILDPSKYVQPIEWHKTKEGKKAIFWAYVSNIPPLLVLVALLSGITTIVGIFL